MGDRAGAWLRVSSSGQDEDNQVPDVMGWITGHDYEVAKTYRLHGKSASKGEQQAAIGEMLADMRAGVITVLVVWAADRIERRGALPALALAEQVREAGGRIEYVRDAHLNTANDMSDVMLSLAATMAREETKRKRERIAVARSRSREGGAFLGRPVWGYTTEGGKYEKRLVPTDEGRRLIPQVFELCIGGASLAVIGKWLEGETGREWWPRTIGTMIRNPVYRGVQVDASGRVIHRVAEPLVDAATWKRAGEALDTRPKRGHSDPASRAMLAGALYCPRCDDSPMYRLNTGYYRCTGRGANRRGCGLMVKVAAVDAAVDRIIAEVFDTPVMAHVIVPGNEAEIAARLEEIRFEISQLGAADLPDEEYDARLAALRAERDEIKAAEVVADRVELTATGERYSELWERTPVPERGPWLRSNGFTVTASKARVAVQQGEVSGALELEPAR
jgi:DNA invertase Pin-like site-specific DNA recombinase